MRIELTGTRVGLVGCGNWGALILRDLLSLGCDVAVVAPSVETLRGARHQGATRVGDNIDDLGPVEGVVVATPTTTHVEVIDELLSLGVPIFVEKPLATEVSGPRRLAGLASDRVFVMHKWRYHPGIRALADLAQTAALGAIEGLRLVRTAWGNPHADTDAVWILAPHDLSIALEILGEIPPPRWAVGRYAEGQRAFLLGALGHSPWVHLEVGSCSSRRERRIELLGSDGVAVLAGGDADEIVVSRGSDAGAPVEERISVAGEMPLLTELRAFAMHLRGGPPPRSSLAEEIAIIEAIVRLRQLAGLP